MAITHPRRHRRARLHSRHRPCQGHIKALQKLAEAPGCITHNLGTGTGYSVLEMVAAFEAACGRPSHTIVPRRPGDIAECYADPERARRELGWQAGRTWQRCASMPGAGSSKIPQATPEPGGCPRRSMVSDMETPAPRGQNQYNAASWQPLQYP